MVAPFEAVTAIHNAFRRALKEIDEAVLQAAKVKGDMSSVIDRLKWFGQILDFHAKGEKEVVFTALERFS